MLGNGGGKFECEKSHFSSSNVGSELGRYVTRGKMHFTHEVGTDWMKSDNMTGDLNSICYIC